MKNITSSAVWLPASSVNLFIVSVALTTSVSSLLGVSGLNKENDDLSIFSRVGIKSNTFFQKIKFFLSWSSGCSSVTLFFLASRILALFALFSASKITSGSFFFPFAFRSSLIRLRFSFFSRSKIISALSSAFSSSASLCSCTCSSPASCAIASFANSKSFFSSRVKPILPFSSCEIISDSLSDSVGFLCFFSHSSRAFSSTSKKSISSCILISFWGLGGRAGAFFFLGGRAGAFFFLGGNGGGTLGAGACCSNSLNFLIVPLKSLNLI